MLRDNGPTRLNVVPNRSAPQADALLGAVKEAAAADFDVLGEIGRGEAGVIIYLASEASSRRLVALRLQRDGQLADEFTLEIVRHLDNSMPAPESKCVQCGKAIKGWARFCSYCGADFTGVAPKEGDAVERALMLEAVKDAVSDEFDVLGEMSRTEGGGAVYFACDRKTGKIVALRLQREGAGEEFSVGLTTALKPIARSLGVKSPATQALSALSRPNEPAGLPPVVPPAAPSVPPAPRPGPAAPPPLPPAAAGMSGRNRLMLAGVLAVAVATALIVISLPKSAPAPIAPAPVVDSVPPAPRVNTPAAVVQRPESTVSRAAPPPVVATAPVAARPKDATIRIAGLPQGAEIRVDDRIRPGRSLSVAPGRHIIAVSLGGYLPRTDTLRLRPGEAYTWAPTMVGDTPKAVVRAPDSRPAPKPVASSGPTCAASVQSEQWPAAFESCMREALAGSASAKRSVALLYERGKGVARSDESAARWLEDAANAGDRDAMDQLAAWYERGRGVKKDQAAALKWYTRAGDAGQVSAQLTLGETYEKGRLGVIKDKAKALDWYRKAAAQGNKAAADKVRDLAK